MTQEDYIEPAARAVVDAIEECYHFGEGDWCKMIDRAIRQAVAEEREACAETATEAARKSHSSDSVDYYDGWKHGALSAAKAIRARGEKP